MLDADPKVGKISNGGLKEGDGALLALVGHDLHERDARSIVDADMDELPADAVVAVDHARPPSGDAVPDTADPAELLDVDMDEFARVLALITPDRFGSSPQFVQPQPTRYERRALSRRKSAIRAFDATCRRPVGCNN